MDPKRKQEPAILRNEGQGRKPPESLGYDPKPGDLILSRVKSG